MAAIPIRIKLGLQKTGKVWNMKSILVTALALLKAHWSKETKMSIEYHLRKPSISVFLWAVITKICGGIQRDKDAFEHTRDDFYIEYVLPIGQSLGYAGVSHSLHFDTDFFAPYIETSNIAGIKTKIYPSIKGHSTSPLTDITVAYDTLALMETKLLTTAQIVPNLYSQRLKKK